MPEEQEKENKIFSEKLITDGLNDLRKVVRTKEKVPIILMGAIVCLCIYGYCQNK